MWQNPSLTLLVSFAGTLFSALICMRLSYATGILRREKSESVLPQRQKISNFGGISLLVGILFGMWITEVPFHFYGSYILPIVPVFLVGLLKDIYTISYWWLIPAQCSSILLFIVLNGYHTNLILAGICMYWMLLLLNAVIALDVFSGLAQGVLLAGLFPIMSYYWLVMPISWSLCVSALFAAMLALFILSVPRPYMGLGYSGALLIGSLYGFIIFDLPMDVSYIIRPYILFLFAFVPIIEANALFAIRFFLNKPLLSQSKHYMVHFLLKKGWERWTILALPMFFQVGLSYAGIYLGDSATWYSLVFFVCSTIVLWYQVVYSPFPFSSVKTI